jgi:hypothetical protein
MVHRDKVLERCTRRLAATAVAAAMLLAACSGGGRDDSTSTAQSCMTCHNGSSHNDYAGPGLENPHPFPGADNLLCTTCHGGDGNGQDRLGSHVPPPPQIGDRQNLIDDPEAYFNRLTLAGLDKYPDYTANGRNYTALDYLQFINPGDIRVVTQNRSCGTCHQRHADCVEASPLATEMGILSGAMYAAGHDNHVPANAGLYLETAADLGFRAVVDPDFVANVSPFGTVGEIREHPVYSKRRGPGNAMFRSQAYSAAGLVDDLNADGSVITNSPLAHLFHEQIAATCGDCHLGSAGANNRAGDYRSSGCTACHMPYSLGGRTGSRDPNVDRTEPIDPDDIDEPERAHVRGHRIRGVARTLGNGVTVDGIDDLTCAGCHQGSNRTVMQYWGIRLDQNQNLRNRVQYPANPVRFTNTARDTRLFDPAVGNNTFNGRNANQYIAVEDYDGDNRDDTPPDVHHEAGLGCVDCHGSYELHGGDTTVADGKKIPSRMEHGVAIRCENCHGSVDAYASTAIGTGYDGTQRELALDSAGKALRHVVKEADGNLYLTSRLTGRRHFVVQTRDVTVDTGRLNPFTNQPVYSVKASYAMGRADNDPSNGIGPQQVTPVTSGFSHMDNMSCASCHASWTNTCVGCHLQGEYDEGNNFSNITGERIVFDEEDADFVYQSPVPFQLGVGPDNKIEQFASNTKVFFQYKDLNDNRSEVFGFSDRSGRGANPSVQFPSLGFNTMLHHSIRGKVASNLEGPRYCVACHLTTEGMTNHGTAYGTFRTQMANNDFGSLDYNLLQTHIGRNPGNQLNSPIWVHMVAGLGSGLFLFDKQGRPINPLDSDADRQPFEVAPNTRFNPALVYYNLDRVVLPTGVPTASNNHAMLVPPVPNLRDGAPDPQFAGPLGATLIRRLSDPTLGFVLDSWLDADGAVKGNAGNWIQ